jgi:2-amino-4-hydroxy-6-hydroxymethyldihydropteridine diphosphokinase
LAVSIQIMFSTVYLLLGSNRGDRFEALQQARSLISQRAGTIIKASTLYETAPWGFADEIYFLNQVVCIETLLPPFDLLSELLSIETSIGRTRPTKNYSSRVIDVDILFYNDQIIDHDQLKIPHPRLHLRRFTLAPLSEIACGFIHPLFGKSIATLLEECHDKMSVTSLIETQTH